jgi:hypothetical protein
MTELILGMVMLASTAGASQPPAAVGTTTISAGRLTTLTGTADPQTRLKLPSALGIEEIRPDWRLEPPRLARAAAAPQSSKVARVLGVALGAVGGFMAGGMIGFYTTQDRDVYDDGVSGLRGVVIGAPVGAGVGALLGFQLAK